MHIKHTAILWLILVISFSSLANDENQVSWNGETYQHYFADINGDGVKDLFLHSLSNTKKSQYVIGARSIDKVEFLNKNRKKLPLTIQDKAWDASVAKVVLSDFTGDSKADLWVVNEQQKQAFLVNTNKKGKIKLTNITQIYSKKDLPWLKNNKHGFEYYSGDFNGDRLADVLVTSQNNGKHHLLHSDDQGRLIKSQSFKKNVKWGLKKAEKLIIADFNKDGRDDIFAISRNKNKSNYVIFSDERGEIVKDNQKKFDSKLGDYSWAANEHSIIVANAGGSENLELIRLQNAVGGYDENGDYWEEEPLELGSESPVERSQNLVGIQVNSKELEQCSQLYFSPESEVSGFTCAPYTKEALSNKQNTLMRTASIQSSNNIQSSAFSLNASCEDPIGLGNPPENCPLTPPPLTPSKAPTLPSSYIPVKTNYQVSVSSVNGAIWYELYEGRTNSSYQLVGYFSGGNLSTTRNHSNYGYVYYKYKACNTNGCSGFSPYKRIQLFTGPGTPPLSVSDTKPKISEPFSITYTVPGGSVPGSQHTLSWDKNGSYITIKRWTFTSWNQRSFVYTFPNGISSKGKINFRGKSCNPQNAGCGGTRTVSVDVVPKDPSTPRAPILSLSGNDLTVRWSSTANTSYYKLHLYHGSKFIKTLPDKYTGTSVTFKDVDPASNIRYKISACNSINVCSVNSGFSNGVTIDPIPTSPIITISPSTALIGQTYRVSITGVSYADYYLLKENGVSLSGTSYVTSKSVPGTYTYTGRACNESGCSAVHYKTILVKKKPSISLTSPINGASVSSLNSITAAATVSDSDGTIAKVEFKVDGVKIGQVSSFPYSYNLGVLNPGNRTICAIATDNHNLSNEDCHTVLVKQPKLGTPVISPSSGSFVGSKHITISTPQSSAQIYYRISGESSYQLYPSSGITITDSTTINAYASLDKWENSSVVTASFTRQFAPTVSITSPSTNQKISHNSNVVAKANANDTDGTITHLYFKLGNGQWVEDSTSPYSVDFGVLQAGNHTIHVRSKDNSGLDSPIKSVTFTVERANSAPVISGTPTSSINVNQFYSFTPSATDSDNDNLTFSIQNKPAWATFNSSTGRLYGTPSSTDTGINARIVIGTTDGLSNVVKLPEFEIEVISPPIGISITNPVDGSELETRDVLVTAQITDEADLADVKFTNDGATWVSDTDGRAPWQYNFDNLDPGNYTFQAKSRTFSGVENLSLAVSVNVNLERPVLSIEQQPTPGEFIVSWASIVGAQSYLIEQSIDNEPFVFVESITSTSKTFVGYSFGTYRYRVKACVDEACSGYSDEASFVIELDIGQCPTHPDNQ